MAEASKKNIAARRLTRSLHGARRRRHRGRSCCRRKGHGANEEKERSPLTRTIMELGAGLASSGVSSLHTLFAFSFLSDLTCVRLSFLRSGRRGFVVRQLLVKYKTRRLPHALTDWIACQKLWPPVPRRAIHVSHLPWRPRAAGAGPDRSKPSPRLLVLAPAPAGAKGQQFQLGTDHRRSSGKQNVPRRRVRCTLARHGGAPGRQWGRRRRGHARPRPHENDGCWTSVFVSVCVRETV